ncbi:STAS domain-containing protein [Gordonia terrae]|jgi:anti-sigma B factor antagonist|uniref:STAS domain-containing protein n=1 Tax=Gordonia terrae TaxID=2055 RepID=UPI003F6AABC7
MQADNPEAVIVDDSGFSAGRALMSVVSVAHEELVILTVEGSIDVLTAPQLSDAVSQALSGRPRGLIIDLTSTEFLASAGMAALVAAHEAIAPSGLFGVVAAGPATTRPLTIMGLDQTMILYPTLTAAVTAMTCPEGMVDRPAG